MLSAKSGGVRTPLSPLAQATLEKHLPGLSTKGILNHVQRTKTKVDATCITDICCCEELPEVEIISLLEEQIPKYKVRSDFLTDFIGYSNQDWFISAPALPIPPEGLKLTKDQIRETLNYFLLCGNRVSQMTRTYDDIEAVTRLLEEKEKDLELTVQIGKELLTQNNRLEQRITDLEQELKSAQEERAQLIHDLHQKNELIAVLTNDVEDNSEPETPTSFKSISVELMQKKIASLQDENKILKFETSQLVKQTDEVEEQEKKLMENITSQLHMATSNYDAVALELERQKEENRLQHEQIISLSSRLAEAELRLHQLTAENDEQVSLLTVTKENQNMLALELADFKQRYQEVLDLLQEAQDYMRKTRKRQPLAKSSFIVSGIQPDSLHLELMESSVYSENSLDSGIGIEHKINNLSLNHSTKKLNGSHNENKMCRLFDTVKCAYKNGQYSDATNNFSTNSLSSISGPRVSAMPYMNYDGNPAGSYHRHSSTNSFISSHLNYDCNSIGTRTTSCESLTSHSDDGYPRQPSGVPGAPGAKDLEAALKRLTPAEVLARRAMLSHAPVGTYNYDEQSSRVNSIPLGIRTPDSIMSTGSSLYSNMSDSFSSQGSKSNRGSSSSQWRLPEKLQIVKPMEGSQTLGHWSRLATPTLSGLLEERPGVTIRGGRGLEELGLQLYSLSDVEEDVDDLTPAKHFQDSNFTYTFTTSHIMHPDDGFLNDLSFLSQSQLSSRMASTSTSRQPSYSQTPRSGISRKNSFSTVNSINMGLASMLNERGIKAVTQSALNTPAGANFSPTVTPCNSPEGSPRSRSPEPIFSIISSGADLIRRKLIGDIDRSVQEQQHKNNLQSKQQKLMLSRLEKRALRSLRLVEKVESVGLENIIATQSNAMNQLACGIASRSASPMTQLTSLKNIQPINNRIVDDLQFDRHQIRAVLNKGLSSENQNSIDTTTRLIKENKKESTNEICKSKLLAKDDNSLNFSSPQNSQQITQQDETQKLPAAQNDQNETLSEIRQRQLQRQKSKRNLKNGQRSDLGTVSSNRMRSDLGKVETSTNKVSSEEKEKVLDNIEVDQIGTNSVSSGDERIKEQQQSVQQSITQSFVGSFSSLFFGRKGGWL